MYVITHMCVLSVDSMRAHAGGSPKLSVIVCLDCASYRRSKAWLVGNEARAARIIATRLLPCARQVLECVLLLA